MPDWLVPFVSLLIGFVGAIIGAGSTILAKRYFDADYLRYLDERRGMECDHETIISTTTTPFCEICQRIFTDDELARWRIRKCQHRRVNLIGEHCDTLDLICVVCTAEFTVNKTHTER